MQAHILFNNDLNKNNLLANFSFLISNYFLFTIGEIKQMNYSQENSVVLAACSLAIRNHEIYHCLSQVCPPWHLLILKSCGIMLLGSSEDAAVLEVLG